MSVNQIIKGLWLGDCEIAVNPTFFSKNNIGAVINCTPDIPNKFQQKGVDYLRLVLNDSLKDVDTKKMIKFLPSAIFYLNQKRDKEKKNILVHCHAGMQRSAAVVTAYLCNFYKLNLDEAINLILKQRPVAFHHGKHVNFSDALFHYTSPQRHIKIAHPKISNQVSRSPKSKKNLVKGPQGSGSRGPHGSVKKSPIRHSPAKKKNENRRQKQISPRMKKK